MFQTGIFHWYGYIQPFEERIKLIKEANFEYVMLWWEDESYPNIINKKELINIVKNYELKIDNVHLPFEETNLLWSEDKSKSNFRTDKIINWMNECKNCGVNTVVMHTTQGDNLKLNYSTGYESFSKIIKEAENIKLEVAFENTQMLNYTDFILNEFDTKYAGLCYDSSHDFVNGQSEGGILEKWKHKLLSVHLSDNDGVCDRHWIPGKGHVNWEKIINIIKQTNLKSFSMETYPYKEEKELEPIDFLKKARSSLLSKL